MSQSLLTDVKGTASSNDCPPANESCVFLGILRLEENPPNFPLKFACGFYPVITDG
jgi:hypothetical protein